MLKELAKVSHKASKKSCCDLSCCTDRPQFSIKKKVIKNLLICKRVNPLAGSVHQAQPGVADGAALGLSKGAGEGTGGLCCHSGGPRASPVQREAGGGFEMDSGVMC